MPALRIRYQTIEFDQVDIHVRTLRDKQQYLDRDNAAQKLNISSASWPLFGVVWASSRILAELLCDYDIGGKRILEVGCGIGLSSLLLNQRQANITATDHHPEAEHFLSENVKLNQGRAIPFVRTGWAEKRAAWADSTSLSAATCSMSRIMWSCSPALSTGTPQSIAR